jgi:N-methylhydantoinase A
MVQEYELSPSMIKLVGGGGSGGVLVPYLGKEMGYKWTVAQNAPYISTIGVALAMVREIVERSVVNPTNNDIIKIRQEVVERIVKSGADENTVEVVIDIDKRNNILRAIATGATEFRAKDLLTKSLNQEALSKIAADSMEIATPEYVSGLGKWHIFTAEKKISKLFGLYKTKENPIRILDREGIVRLQRQSGNTYIVESSSLQDKLSHLIDFHTTYSDAGATIPKTVLLFAEKMVDLSGLINKEQVLALASTEHQMAPGNKTGIVLYH